MCTGFQGFQGYFRPDFRDSKDLEDLKYSNGFRPDFKEFSSGVRDFSDSESGFMNFGPDFMVLRSELKGFRLYSRDSASDFKDSGDFTSDFKVFKPNLRDFWSDFRVFRSDFRTSVRRISEVVDPPGDRYQISISLKSKCHRKLKLVP